MRNGITRLSFITALAFCALFTITAEGSQLFDSQDLVRLNGGSFTIGEGAQTYTARRTVKDFQLSRYETTYFQWYQVRIWAELQGYYFANPGQAGANGKRGAAPTSETMNLPVTTITWYDAIVWCNAASEYEGRTPCYTYDGEVLRDSEDTASCDLAICNWNADGYRLPSEAEWEYAARKNLKTGAFQSAAYVSGEDGKTGYAADAVAWTADNSEAVHIVGTAGTPRGSIQEKGAGNANGAGLYDMSGNVLEYCWDWMASYNDVSAAGFVTGPEYGSARVSRGGSWSPFTLFAGAGDRYAYDPNEAYNYMGFRIARTTTR